MQIIRDSVVITSDLKEFSLALPANAQIRKVRYGGGATIQLWVQVITPQKSFVKKKFLLVRMNVNKDLLETQDDDSKWEYIDSFMGEGFHCLTLFFLYEGK